MTRDFKNPWINGLWEYGIITVSILFMTVGTYFFKFPNNFAFGGVTGFSTVFSALTKWSASQFTLIVNMALLVLGFLFLGRGFGIKTVYASVLMSLGLSGLEKISAHDSTFDTGTFVRTGLCYFASGSWLGSFV